MKPHHKGSPGGLVNTRQQWSKYICGMINSGLGGVLYGGIFDNGEVNGFMMSQYQRVHVALQLQEVLQRFQPPVPPELVSVQFVPIQETFDQGVGMKILRYSIVLNWRQEFEFKSYVEFTSLLRCPPGGWGKDHVRSALPAPPQGEELPQVLVRPGGFCHCHARTSPAMLCDWGAGGGAAGDGICCWGWRDLRSQVIGLFIQRCLSLFRRQGSTDWLEGRPEDWCWKHEAGTVSIYQRWKTRNFCCSQIDGLYCRSLFPLALSRFNCTGSKYAKVLLYLFSFITVNTVREAINKKKSRFIVTLSGQPIYHAK